MNWFRVLPGGTRSPHCFFVAYARLNWTGSFDDSGGPVWGVPAITIGGETCMSWEKEGTLQSSEAGGRRWIATATDGYQGKVGSSSNGYQSVD